MKYCIYCGSRNEDGYTFCVSCGQPLGEDDSLTGVFGDSDNNSGFISETSGNGNPTKGIAFRSAIVAIVAALALGGGVAAYLNKDRIGMMMDGFIESRESVDVDSQTTPEKKTITITFKGGGAGQGEVTPIICEEGDRVTLPECGFTRQGYEFSCWEDGDGHQYAPYDSVKPKEDLTLWAVWETADSDDPTPGPLNTTDASSARDFPRTWSGTYLAYSPYVEGGSITRTLRIDFNSVSENGKLEGICYIGANDPESGTGSYYIEGNINWDTGSIMVEGTKWYKQEDVKYMRTFTGSVSSDNCFITGTSAMLDGSHLGKWEMQSN